MEIKLKKANVVKQVDSEDKAKALEAKGFIRDGAETKDTPKSGSDGAALEKENTELKKSLMKASEIMKTADQRKGELEKELADTKEKLDEAAKYAQELEKELETVKKAVAKTKQEK